MSSRNGIPELEINNPSNEPNEDFTPEKRLLIAIVQRALVDYIAPEKGKPHLQYDAGAWIFSEKKNYPFTLFWVCEILSVDPSHLHKRIQIAARSKAYKPKCVIMRVEGGAKGTKGTKGSKGTKGT